jgi:Secretion system C-terminal sorting domain
MKRILLFTFILISALALNAQKTWTGTAGDGLWETVGNWSPSVPVAGDEVLFNNGASNTVTLPTTGVTIGQLKISNKTTLNLKSTHTAGVNLNINGIIGSDDLVVNSECSLNLIGASNTGGQQLIQIIVATGATGSITGNISFSNSGTANIAHRLLATDANSVTFQSGSIFSGDAGTLSNAFGATNLNSILFAAGSTYIHNGITGNPFGASAPNSVIILDPASNFILKTTSGFATTGRTYGNLEIAIPSASTATASTTTACNVNGNLTITSGTLNVTSTSGLNVKGNFSIASGATLSLVAGNVITLNGTTQQTVAVNGTFTMADGTSQLRLNNPQGAMLNTPLVVKTFRHSQGKLIIGNNNFTIENNYNEGSNLSYVVTNGTGTFTIPLAASATKTAHVGLSTTSYDPVEFTNDATAKSFSVKVGNTLPYPTLSNANTIARVWDINRIGSGDLAQLKLTAGDLTTIAGGTFAPSVVVLGHGNGTTYDAIAATYSLGTITSSVPVTTFSPFIIANDVALGVDLKSLNATKTSDNKVQLAWQTASEKNNSGFEIQRSGDGKAWAKIGFMKGMGTTSVEQNYSFMDVAPLSTNYYRLRQLDFDGKETYSNVVNVAIGKVGNVIKVYPNPIQQKTAIVELNDAWENIEIKVYNAFGAVVKQQKANSNTVTLDLNALAKGIYFIEAAKDNVRFVERVVIAE